MLVNLISNSIKFTLNGHIKIILKKYINDRSILKVTVEDTGLGMNNEVLAQLG